MPLESTIKTWLDVPEQSDFSIHNLPYGIFSTIEGGYRVGMAIGNYIVDLKALAEFGHFKDLSDEMEGSVFGKKSLNAFIGLGKPVWQTVRSRVQQLLCQEDSPLRQEEAKALVPMRETQMHMPVEVGDYTDFYSSLEHATHVGSMFRGKENALMPNWKHLPVAYHGRASSIVASGQDIHRPKGQTMPAGAEKPEFGPSKALDFELEMAFVIGKNSKLGQSVSIQEAEDYIFGFLLFNDWSARDIQKWEYVPLGPFLGKNFASSVSPWIITLDALEPFRVAGPEQSPEPLPYLQFQGKRNFDIKLEVDIQVEGADTVVVSRSNFKYLYWNISQQLAHHTINGCNVRVGDLMASGTISGKDRASFGSMLELTWNGEKPLVMPDGNTRKFLEDHDTVIMRGWAEKEGIRIGFGEVRTKILPAL